MQIAILPSTTPAEVALATRHAVEHLGAGQPVALPTETVYGLAGDITNRDALLRIFESKERPFFDPLIVHLPDATWLEKVTEIAEIDRTVVEKLIAAFWPGPLTLVLPRTRLVPDLVTSGLDTVAVRMSAHPVFSSIIQAFGRPLAAPSANRFGRISPTSAAHVFTELEGRIPLIVDGGATEHGIESTVVLVRKGRLLVLRDGPITREQLNAFTTVDTAPTGARPEAPGQLKSHYAPRTPMELLSSGAVPLAAGAKVGLLAWNNVAPGFQRVEVLSPTADFREAAATLFAKLRRLDEAGLDRIVAEQVPETGLGLAIMDRLRKAAARG